MSLSKSIVSRPVTYFVIFVLLIGMGFFGVSKLSVDLMPDITFPYLMVSTTYTGAGPEEIERTVTRTLEAALASVSGLKSLSSTSSKGSSMVMMEFTYGTDLSDAANFVRDAVDRVKRYLPDNADPPTIFKFDPSMMPIMTVTVMSTNRTPDDLRQISSDMIIPRLEQIPGVATASVRGGRDKQIRVEIDSTRLDAYGLTVTQLQQMIAAQNLAVSAGTITESGLSYILTTNGEYTDINQINNTVISYASGAIVNGKPEPPVPIFVRDIANVFAGYADQVNSVYVDGLEAVQLSIQKQSGKNSVAVAKDVRKRLVRINAEVPGDITIVEASNNTDQIEASLNNVMSSAASGIILVVLVLFTFLRSIKPTLIIGLSIPISILITLLAMYFNGMTLNLMTLAGLFLGIGMLVDNSIVILENIFHYREKGAKLTPAAILGTQEMITAITASTLTSVCVFLPLIMFKGLLEMPGEMFAGLAFTVVFSLSVSLLVALFLVPILSSHFFPIVTRKQVPLTGTLAEIDAKFDGFFKWLEGGYRHLVVKILRRKKLVIGTLVLVLIGSCFLTMKIGYVFMPESAADNVTMSVTMPLGTSLPETRKTLKELEILAKNELQIDGKPVYRKVTLTAGGGGRFSSGGTNSGSLRFDLPKWKQQKMNAVEVQDKLRPFFNQYPGVKFSFRSGGMGGMGGSSNPIDVVIKAEDLVKGKAIADKIADLIKENMPEATEPTVSLTDGLPQYEIELNRDRMYAMGLTASQVGNEIKAAVDGITATRYKEGRNTYDVVLIFKEADRNSTPKLDQIFVKTAQGQRVPLSNFAEYKKGTGPMTISREEQSRVIHVTAGAKPGSKLNEVDSVLQALVKANIPSEDDVIIQYEGDNSEMKEIFGNFILVIVVAIGLVFGVMAGLFESFLSPFIIILTIPLSLIGVIFIYFITGDQFNVMTVVGFLVLLGVIVNNGIVLVDYTDLLRKRGLSLQEACVEAAGNRLRPILMSTLTTVIGLAPMAFAPGDGSEMVGPIGKTIFGGLSFGTLMTLFLMPAVYAIINKNSDLRKMRAAARREGIAAGKSARELREERANKRKAERESAALSAEEKNDFFKAGI
ncbi:MAG: efflux RND transporter permease subunit [Termitinemataceae bacterium]|nr:MAG: efflux RND transporter permease subunit [Termitinemataceae bacterium]